MNNQAIARPNSAGVLGRQEKENSHGDSPKVPYGSFSEFLRLQFLQSRQFFLNVNSLVASHHGEVNESSTTNSNDTSKRPKSAHLGKSRDGQFNDKNKEYRRPQYESTKETSTYERQRHNNQEEIDYLSDPDFEETVESISEVRRKPKILSPKQKQPTTISSEGYMKKARKRLRRKKAKATIIPYEEKAGPNGVRPVPGPGSYHQPSTLIKPTFNRIFTEPSHLPGYLQPTSSSRKSAGTVKPPSSPEAQREDTLLWQNYKNAVLISKEKERSRLTSQNVTVGLPHDETISFKVKDGIAQIVRDVPAEGFYGGEPVTVGFKKVVSAASKDSILWGMRYPLESDDKMKRWVSISHDSFVKPKKQMTSYGPGALVGGGPPKRTKVKQTKRHAPPPLG